MKNILRVIGGIFIASIGVLIFVKQVNIKSVLFDIIHTPFWKIAVVILLNILTLYFRSLRWRMLLPSNEMATKKGLFPLVTIGFMVNNFFPARIGEIVRIVLLWKRNKFTLAESTGSLLLERFIDSLTFGVFLIASLLFLPQLKKWEVYGYFILGGFCIVIIFFLLYRSNPIIFKKIIYFFIKKLPYKISLKLKNIVEEVFSTLDWLFSVKKIFCVVVLSALTTSCHALMVFALGYGTSGMGILTSMFVVTFAAIGAMIPLSPGYVGTLHAVMLSSFTILGIESDKGGTITVLYHAICYISVSLLGIYYFLTLKVNLNEIKKENIKDI